MSQQLSKKPLVEALLEVKWALKETSRGTKRDPAYPLFIGRLYDQVKDSYGHVQELEAAQVPDEITPHIVKHRFRRAEEEWPLVQAGPGIASLNFADPYTWDMFLEAAKEFLPKLLDAYSSQGQQAPRFTSILLRYINGIEIDFERENFIDYVSSNLHTSIVLPKDILDSPRISGFPEQVQLLVANPLKNPNGVASIRIASGKLSGKPAVIWELNIQSTNDDVPQEENGFETWLVKSHETIESWFFTFIQGDLLKQFGGT